MYYQDRNDAAAQLLMQLQKYKGQNALVLAIPRGGVPVGCAIARMLNFPVDLLMTKKIGHPDNPELAIGAVSLDGYILDPYHNVTNAYIHEEVKRIRSEMAERYRKFRKNQPPDEVDGKVIIIVDDGMATGNTVLSSISMLRRKNPSKIVVAVPVAPPGTIEKVKPFVDELICPYAPSDFLSVGRHYRTFDQVDDEQVVRELEDLAQRKSQE